MTILLTISKGTFVDADDPRLARFREAGDRAEEAHCGMSVFGVSQTTTNATTYLSMCNIEFIHPGVIDIKYISFTSCQHIVAHRINGLAFVNSPLRWRNRSNTPMSSSRGGRGTLEIIIEYDTALNMRYLAPIVASSTASGGGPETTASSPSSCSSLSYTQPLIASMKRAMTSRPDDNWLQPLEPGLEQMAKTVQRTGAVQLPVVPLLTAKSLGPAVGQRVIKDMRFALQSTGEGKYAQEMVTTMMTMACWRPILWG